MNKYYFVFLVWLLPAYFVFQGGYQVLIYQGTKATFESGESYLANVTDFDVKQIAAQTNGYVVLQFETADNDVVEKQLALTVQMAQVIMDSELIPIRYRAESFSPIVMMPTYDLQKTIISVNLAVSGIGLLVTLLVAIWASKFAVGRLRDGEETLELEHVDQDQN